MGRRTSRPDNDLMDLLTGLLKGPVDLRSLLPNGSHFLPGEQAQHLDVVEAIG